MSTHWRAIVGFSAFCGFAAGPTQGPGLNPVMRDKLEHTQKILAPLSV